MAGVEVEAAPTLEVIPVPTTTEALVAQEAPALEESPAGGEVEEKEVVAEAPGEEAEEKVHVAAEEEEATKVTAEEEVVAVVDVSAEAEKEVKGEVEEAKVEAAEVSPPEETAKGGKEEAE